MLKSRGVIPVLALFNDVIDSSVFYCRHNRRSIAKKSPKNLAICRAFILHFSPLPFGIIGISGGIKSECVKSF